jgi:hypothetical protein
MFRILKLLGIVRIAIIAALLTASITVVYKLLATGKYDFQIAAAVVLFIFLIHIRRRDRTFLKINFQNYRLFLAMEYFVLLLPVFVCILLTSRWLILPIIILCVPLISFIDVNIRFGRKTHNTRLQSLIPDEMYEWKAGVRQNLVLLITVYIAGVCLSWLVAAVPVAMCIIGLIISEFTVSDEPWTMLLAPERPPEKLIFSKLWRHCALYSLVNLPLMAVFLIFHPDLWHIPLILFGIFISIHIYLITARLAFYEADRNGKVNALLAIFGFLAGLTVILIPLLLLFSAYFIRKASINLKPLLDDYN